MSWSEGRPERRAAVILAFTAGVALAAFTWWPNGDYRPIQPGERGTIQGGLRSVAAISSGRPSLTPERERELGGAPSARELEGDRRLQRPKIVGKARDRVEQRKPRAERKRSRATPTPTATPRATATPARDRDPRRRHHRSRRDRDPGRDRRRRSTGDRHADRDGDADRGRPGASTWASTSASTRDRSSDVRTD